MNASAHRPAIAAAAAPSLPLRAAIVDLDGTMVDTVGDFELALNAMLGEAGERPVDRAFLMRTIGKGSEYLIERTLAHVGARIAYDTAFERYQHHYATFNGRASAVFPGVAGGLQRLRDAGLRLACITNKPTRHAKALLAAKGLDAHFDHVFGGDAFARKKPDPLPIVEACRALGAAPRETLVVGDSANDVAAARGAGCPVVLVGYGYNHGEPAEAAGADAVVARLDEIDFGVAAAAIRASGPGPAAGSA